jgi:hypothetical protein
LDRDEVSGEVYAQLERLLHRAQKELGDFDKYLHDNVLKEAEGLAPIGGRPRLRRRAKLKEVIGEAQQQIDGLQQGLLSIKVNITLVLGVAQL